MSAPKELNFFCADPELGGSLSDAAPSERSIIRNTNRNWARGIDWYASHFDAEAPKRGEASPNYTAPYHPRAAERMASVIPDAHLIFLVRDPLDQVVSQYLHFRDGGNEPRKLSDALVDPHGIYLERARYHARLQPYLDHFPAEQIKVVPQEELRANRRDTLAAVFRFAGVDDAFWSPRLERERHASHHKGRRSRLLRRLQNSRLGGVGHRLPQEAKWYLERLATAGSGSSGLPSLDEDTSSRIVDALEDDVAQLRKATGLALSEWRL